MSRYFRTRKRRIIIGLVAGCAVAVALIVTLSVTLRDVPNTPTTGTDVIEPPDTEPESPPVTVKQTMGLPVVGTYTVDKGFAKDKLLYCATQKLWKTHEGIDFKVARGTDVTSILDGEVTKTGTTTLDGTYVVITHSDGRVSTYKSLDAALPVKVGDKVQKGSIIGRVSDSMLSEAAQGAHLHFELSINGETVNPVDYIAELGGK